MDENNVVNTQLSNFFKEWINQQTIEIIDDNAKIPSRSVVGCAIGLDANSLREDNHDCLVPLSSTRSAFLWKQKRPSSRWRSNSKPLPSDLQAPPSRRPSPNVTVRKTIPENTNTDLSEEQDPKGDCDHHAWEEDFSAGTRWKSEATETGASSRRRSISPPKQVPKRVSKHLPGCFSASDTDLSLVTSNRRGEGESLRRSRQATKLFNEVIGICDETVDYSTMVPPRLPIRRNSCTLEQGTQYHAAHIFAF